MPIKETIEENPPRKARNTGCRDLPPQFDARNRYIEEINARFGVADEIPNGERLPTHEHDVAAVLIACGMADGHRLHREFPCAA
jgi:hypothetical protein